MNAYKCDICGCYCDEVYRNNDDTFDVYPGDKITYGLRSRNKTELRDMCNKCYDDIKAYIHGKYLNRAKESD